MKPICAAAVAKVLGREPTKAEQDSIQARIYASMKELQAKDPDAWSSMSRESRLLEGAKLARAKTLEDTTRAHAATLRDVELKAREIDNLGRVEAGVGKGKGQLNALNQRTLFDAKLEGKGTSLEQDIHAVYNESMSRLDNFGGKGKFFGAVQNPVEQHALIRAIRGEATGKPEIDKAGESIRRELEILHQKANDAGIHIHELDDWHHPQPIAWEKVAARRDEFEADALNHIDRSKYITRDGTPMTDEQIQKSVAASAETLGTDGANKQIDSAGGYGKGRVGGSRNAPRQLHYKDAASYQFMMDKYGSANNVYSLITHHIRGMARDIATAERFGRDADTFYPQLAERAFMADAKAIGALDIAPEKKEKLLKQLKGQKNNTLNMWKGLRHPDAPGAIPLWARISQNIRGVAQSTLLGGAPSAFPDAAMATEYMNLRGIARSRVLGNIAEGLKPTKSNIGFVNRLGIVNSHIDASAHRFGSEELGNHAVKYLNHVVHVGGGLRMFDRGMTHGVAASLMDMIGEHTRNTEFHDLDPATAKLAEQYGITKDHWDTWRAADVEKGPNGNHTMVTPETIYSIPDEKLRPMAEQNVAARGDKPTDDNIAREMRNLRSGAAKQLLSTVLSETKIGARGGSGTSMRAQLAYGGALSAGKRGTLAGEAAAWLMLLKQTPFGIAKTHMWDVPRSLDTWGAAAAYRAKFMAGSAFLGAVGTEIKDLILGEDPEDLGTMRGLGKVALASGGFGMYGDFLFGERGDHKNGTLTKLLGPGATMIEDALNLGKSVQSTLAGTAGLDPEPGEPKAIPADKLGAQALAFARNYAMPLTRIWYAKAAFNHMAYQQMMENMAPGYSQRVEQRMQARDQSNWWPTGQATPERAPDMSKMLGQQP
jgi:hypothetical protein